MIYINIPILSLHQYVRYSMGKKLNLPYVNLRLLVAYLKSILICFYVQHNTFSNFCFPFICGCGVPNRKHTGFKSNSLLKLKFNFATTVILYVHMSILCV